MSTSASNAARIATRVQVPLAQAGQVGAPAAAHAPPSFAPRAPPRSVPRHIPPPMQSAAAFGPPPGHQPWTQTKRVEIQTFAGEKLKYEEWKAAFIACVGSSPATPEYKFLQMKQFLSGEALQAVANFGYTQRGYEEAKARLDKKFGGERRQVALYVEELERVGSLSGSKVAELERFADLLEVAVVNLQDAGHTAELGAGTFYMTLLRKLSEQLLTQYQRWLFDNRRRENVLALLEWASQEAEFLTRATETVRGLAPLHSQKPQRQLSSHTGSQRQTYVVNGDPKTSKCPICQGGHVIWHCTEFKAMDNSKRWAATQRANLCFRCLGLGHRGRECGVDGCAESTVAGTPTTLFYIECGQANATQACQPGS